jgi:hypothetical protein
MAMNILNNLRSFNVRFFSNSTFLVGIKIPASSYVLPRNPTFEQGGKSEADRDF